MFVFIFRRDFRIHDNLGLAEFAKVAAAAGRAIAPVFVFNPEQIDPERNPYFCHATVQFMIESLMDLSIAYLPQLRFLERQVGESTDGPALLRAFPPPRSVTDIGFNADITPYARTRDAALEDWCARHGIRCHAYHGDYTLVNGHVPYRTFTPFYNRYGVDVSYSSTAWRTNQTSGSAARWVSWSPTKKNRMGDVSRSRMLSFFKDNDHLAVRGMDARKNALLILGRLSVKGPGGGFTEYERTRDYPASSATTMLSAYLKYGCVSVREVYLAARSLSGPDHPVVRQLFWRAFYDQLAWHLPSTLFLRSSTASLSPPLLPSFPSSSSDRHRGQSRGTAEWLNDKAWFRAWCDGTTGFPLIDAAMRQLNKTGYMPNRCRMVVACFLLRDMNIDWRWGERYFATRLVDVYLPSNAGNWLWVNAQPRFRTFNPWRQSAKYDPDAVYVKRYVPELAAVPAKDVHTWHDAWRRYPTCTYPQPLFDHHDRLKKQPGK